MKIRCLGAFVALSMVSVACSSSPATTPKADTGVTTDTGVVTDTGTHTDTGTPADTGTVADTGSGAVDAGPNLTTGKNCTLTLAQITAKTITSTCDPSGSNTGYCDYTEPTPQCEQNGCDIPDANTIPTCDGVGDAATGICVTPPGATTNVCYGPCQFAADGTGLTGCPGKDTCMTDFITTAPVYGVGHCQGTCSADADCITGLKCQVEYGACVPPASYKTITKTLGTACVRSANDCGCFAPSTGAHKGQGYCVTTCVTGATTAAAGACSDTTNYACSAILPATDFTAQAAGISGYCLQICAADADCTGLSGAAGSCDKTTAGAPTGKGICLPQ
ncbi:MAG: hypothetical protein ACHREM_27760 [Polyangiales bacterium]